MFHHQRGRTTKTRIRSFAVSQYLTGNQSFIQIFFARVRQFGFRREASAFSYDPSALIGAEPKRKPKVDDAYFRFEHGDAAFLIVDQIDWPLVLVSEWDWDADELIENGEPMHVAELTWQWHRATPGELPRCWPSSRVKYEN